MYVTSAIGFDMLGIALHALLRWDDAEDVRRRVIQGLTSYEGMLQNADRAFTGGTVTAARETLFAPRREDQMRATAAGDLIATFNALAHSINRDGFDINDVFTAIRELHLVPLEADIVNRGAPRIWDHITAAIAGRALIFMLVGVLFQVFGAPIKAVIDKYLGWVTTLFVVLVVGGFLAFTQLASGDEDSAEANACDTATQVRGA